MTKKIFKISTILFFLLGFYNVNADFDFSTFSGGSVITSSLIPTLSYPTDIEISDNGLSIFLGKSNSYIYKYNLTTPYDLTTLNTTAVETFLPNESNYGFDFLNFGQNLLIIGNTTKIATMYTCLNAYVLSTCTLTTTKTIGGNSTPFWDIVMTDDGLNFYVSYYGSVTTPYTRIYQYKLTTPFDLTTATLYGEYNPLIAEYVQGLSISRDGKNLFFQQGYSSNTLYMLNLITPFDLTTAIKSIYSYDILNRYYGVISSDGLYYFGVSFLNTGLNKIYRYNTNSIIPSLVSPYDILTQTGSGDPYVSGCSFLNLENAYFTTCSNLDTNLLTGSYDFVFNSPSNNIFTGSVSIEEAKIHLWGGYLRLSGDIFTDDDFLLNFEEGGSYTGTLYFNHPTLGLNYIQNFTVISTQGGNIDITIGIPTNGNYITYCDFVNTYDIFQTKCKGLNSNLLNNKLFYKFTNSSGGTYISDFQKIGELKQKGYIGTSKSEWAIYDKYGGINTSSGGLDLLNFFTNSGTYYGQLLLTSSGIIEAVEIQNFYVNSIGHTQLPIPPIINNNGSGIGKIDFTCDMNNNGDISIIEGTICPIRFIIWGVGKIWEGLESIYYIGTKIKDLSPNITFNLIPKVNAEYTGDVNNIFKGLSNTSPILIPQMEIRKNMIIYGFIFVLIIIGSLILLHKKQE